MKTLVLSQPNYLPWRGMFEQINLSDVLVFYDDVQLPSGGGKGRGFATRVQIKTQNGQQWLSIPIARAKHGKQFIRDVRLADPNWRRKHVTAIRNAYARAPHFEQVFERIVEPLYALQTDFLSEFCRESMTRLLPWLGVSVPVHLSSELDYPRPEDASERVLAVCRHFDARRYLTGHGAANYLRHDIFEAVGIDVDYIEYDLREYPQLHGGFIPYVSVVDLLFNVGPRAPEHLGSRALAWREWMAAHRPQQTDRDGGAACKN